MYVNEILDIKEHMDSLEEQIRIEISDFIIDDFNSDHRLNANTDKIMKVFFSWLKDHVEDIKFK